jgi:hypothetical protein
MIRGMNRRGFSSWILSVGMLASVLTALLWVLNLPFYAGGGGAHWRWRMEHGRVRIEHRDQPVNPESFYVDFNSEGLRFRPEWNIWSNKEWLINVPLWVPSVFSLGLVGWGLSRTRRAEVPG